MTTVDSEKIRRAMRQTKSTVRAPAENAEANRPTNSNARTPLLDPDTIKQTKSKGTPPVATETNGLAKPIPSSSPSDQPEDTQPAESIPDAPPADPVLFTIRQLGRLLDDIELMRIMNGNRIGAGQRAGIDQPWMDTVAGQLDALEHTVELELKRAWRKHPLAPWAKKIPGAGEVLMGRLIAEIGNPADRPNPGKLLAYCGHGDPERAGQIPKGATQEELFRRGNPGAKKAVWKISYQFMRTVGTSQAKVPTESTVATPANEPAIVATTPKQATPVRSRSPYRDIYEQRKAATEGKLHAKPCKRCGPSGHPAEQGSPWSDAHRHADALRIVGKRFLIDLWVASQQAIEKTKTQRGDAS